MLQVDCVNKDSGYGSRGCAGGWPTDVLDYAHRANISREEFYPYTGKTGTCNSEALARTSQDDVARVSKSQGYVRLPSKDNTAFMRVRGLPHELQRLPCCLPYTYPFRPWPPVHAYSHYLPLLQSMSMLLQCRRWPSSQPLLRSMWRTLSR